MKPKLLFVFDHKHESYWLDGLWAAIEELKKDFDIQKYNLSSHTPPENPFMPDFILGWGGFNSSVDRWMQERKQKKGLCIGGNAFPANGMMNYDVLFYETNWVRDFLDLKIHPNIHKAFGINTDIFSPPEYPCPIVWDYIGVGSFSSWKRWEKMNGKKGLRLVIGEYQVGNEEESKEIIASLIKGGVMCSDMVHPIVLANLYYWSRTAYFPSTIYGGGERALLEARSCELQVEVEDDNPKLKELLECPIPSHIDYAEALKKGILSCLN